MTQQLKLDIDRPAWHETSYKSEVTNSWDARRDTGAKSTDSRTESSDHSSKETFDFSKPNPSGF